MYTAKYIMNGLEYEKYNYNGGLLSNTVYPIEIGIAFTTWVHNPSFKSWNVYLNGLLFYYF